MSIHGIRLIRLGCLLLSLTAPAAGAATISADLAARLADAAAGERIPVILNLSERVEPARYKGGRATAGALVADLRDTARRTQAPLLGRLQAKGLGAGVRPLWITNSLALTVDAGGLADLAAWPEVASIDLDVRVLLPEATAGQSALSPVWSLDVIGAPSVWSTFGLTGAGVVIGSMDTGVDISHPALAGKWRGGGNSWLDLVGGASQPYDDHGHGTHTIGTLVGGDGPGPFASDIGVAYGAQFISVKVLDANNSFGSASIVLAGAQWILDPDGNAATDDFPSVVNNSWYFNSQTYSGFHAAVDAWRAAGIIPVFCLGNAGPGAGTTRPPGNYGNTLGIGATTSTDDIASFSSRGPSPVGASFPADQHKPDLSAPGEAVTSSLPGGFYQAWSGTSMATPQVAGTVALMLEARPGLTYDQISGFLRSTAVDLGAAGWDANFGHGRLNAFAAVAAMLVSPVPDGGPAPAPCRLYPARPNPFNPATTLAFELAVAGPVDLSVFDLRGRLVDVVEHGALEAGRHERTWRARDDRGRPLASGIYVARLRAGGNVVTRLLSLVR